jgi:putative restriction endonuclease
VLLAYEYRCAFCGYDGRLATDPVGLDAAHIRWHGFNGPDTVDNGVGLCTLHHKLFDQGAMGIGLDHRVLVSRHFVGRGPTADGLVLGLIGKPLEGPQPGESPPARENLDWHLTQVFREPARV